MINVIIHEKDNFFKRGLMDALSHAFEAKYQRKLVFYDQITTSTVPCMDIIVVDVFPGDNVDCHAFLQYRKKRSVVVGFYEGEAPVMLQRAPLCLRNIVYLNKRSPMNKIRSEILFAWNEQVTGNCDWAEPDCASCTRATLSRQQEKIALLTVRGYNNRQIAGLMNINAKTVSAHKHSIMEKFSIDNNADLVKFLRRKMVPQYPENSDALT